MQDSERSDGADWDWPNEAPGESAGSDPEVSAERQPQRRWSAERKAQIVRESFWPGNRVSDVAQRYGLNRKQLSAWRTLARKGKLALPSSTGPEAEPVAVATEPEPEPALRHARGRPGAGAGPGFGRFGVDRGAQSDGTPGR